MLLQALREATRPLHAALDKNQHLKRLMASDLTCDEYARILSRFYGFYAPIEARLTRASSLPQLVPLWQERMRADYLRQDLACLGFKLDSLALCPPQLTLNRAATAWGCFYVLEGSTLGAQLVARQIRRSLGLDPKTGLRFFSAHQTATASLWRSFCTALEAWWAQPDNTESAAEAISAAQSTFRTLEAWL